jgi:hypothetical protein
MDWDTAVNKCRLRAVKYGETFFVVTSDDYELLYPDYDVCNEEDLDTFYRGDDALYAVEA